MKKEFKPPLSEAQKHQMAREMNAETEKAKNQMEQSATFKLLIREKTRDWHEKYEDKMALLKEEYDELLLRTDRERADLYETIEKLEKEKHESDEIFNLVSEQHKALNDGCLEYEKKIDTLKDKVEKLTRLNASDGVSPAELWVKKKEILKLIEEMEV